MYDFLLVFYRNFVPKIGPDIRFQKCCDLENWVRGPTRSLEMSPCDRAHTTSYSIVTVAQSRSFLRYSASNNVMTLKLGSEVTQGH